MQRRRLRSRPGTNTITTTYITSTTTTIQKKDLSSIKEARRLQLARNLCELFEQIDINGDGTLQWDEFTVPRLSGPSQRSKSGGHDPKYECYVRTWGIRRESV